MKKPILIFVIVLFISCRLTAQSLSGKYTLTKESDGQQPKSGAIISITFNPNGSFSFKATMPGTVVTDKGTYKIIGNNITVSFVEMEQGKQTGPYSLEDGMLTLPFKMLKNVKGSSTWQKEGTVAKNNTIPASSTSDIINKTITFLSSPSASWQAAIDKKVNADASKNGSLLAANYYSIGIALKLKGYNKEAAYAMAKAALLQTNNGLYENNLAMLLIELERYGDAIALLNNVIKGFPKLAPAYGNLAIAYIKINDLPNAITAVNRAIINHPTCGSFLYTRGIIEEKKGEKEKAIKSFEQAFENGYGGTGKQIAKRNAKSGNKPTSPASQKNSQPAAKNTQLSKSEKIAIWEGNYQASYLKARSGETNSEANTQFGTGVATTIINLQTLACVKSFSMNISKHGTISGNAEIMYVYQGKANGPVASLASAPLVAINGGFGAVLKDGFQLRNWQFTGEVDENGKVTIAASLPSEKLDLYNVGTWQKITPWSPLKPDAAGAAMKGPFHFTLTEGKEGKHFVQVDDYLPLQDKLIKQVHYQMLLVKSNNKITPDCQALAQAPEANECPATESIKTKIALSPGGKTKIGEIKKVDIGATVNISTEASTTYTKGNDGKVNASYENAVNTNVEIEAGMVTAAAEFHGDNSYELSIGLGVSSEKILPGFPIEFSESLNLIYDSKCGFGIKGVAAVKGKMGAEANTSAAIEGVIFLKKGL